MKLGTVKKTSVDILREQIDYTEWLAEGEDISDQEFESDPEGLTISAVEVASGVLTFFVAGGEDTESYNLKITVTTGEGQIRQDFITFMVSDP